MFYNTDYYDCYKDALKKVNNSIYGLTSASYPASDLKTIMKSIVKDAKRSAKIIIKKPLLTPADTLCFDEMMDDIYLRIANIHKIIQNKHVTVIIDVYGKKTIVRPQKDSRLSRFSPTIGFNMCLLRYLVSPKRYHELQEYIFDNEESIKEIVDKSDVALVTLIGMKTYEIILNKYLETRDKNE